MKTSFSVAQEFGKTPSARTEEEGKLSGSELRGVITPLLRQCINSHQQFTINMDGTAGYGTSFLEEVFGGLIRNEGFKLSDLEKYLIIVSEEDMDLEDEIWEDISDADKENH